MALTRIHEEDGLEILIDRRILDQGAQGSLSVSQLLYDIADSLAGMAKILDEVLPVLPINQAIQRENTLLVDVKYTITLIYSQNHDNIRVKHNNFNDIKGL